MKKRLFVLLLTIVSVLALTSCSKKFTVSFDSAGGSAVAEQEVKKGQTAEAPANPTKEGYSFEGWFNGSTKFNFSSSITEDITLTAKWKQSKYTVTYNSNGGNAVPAMEVAHGGTATAVTPSKAGFSFVAWTLNGAPYDFATPVTGNITLVATWQEQTGVEYVTVTFNVNGGNSLGDAGTSRVVKGEKLGQLPTPSKDGASFLGWFDANDNKFTADSVISADITLTAKWSQGSSNVYTPKWAANQRTGGWNGQGMVYRILVKPVSSYDPFDGAYSGTNQRIKQNQQRKVMSAYNVVIKYEEWAAAWGPDRITEIKNSVGSAWEYNDAKDSEGQDIGGVYAISIASSWIPTLAKTSCLAPLYNIMTGEGVFAEVGYEEVEEDVWVPGTYQQNDTINEVLSVNSVVYGYSQGNPHPDHFLYYNADLIAEAGLEDPGHLWFKGEWTWDTFTTYCQSLNNSLSGVSPLSVGYPEFFIGANAAYGNPIATSSPRLNLCSNTTYEVLNKIKNLFNSGYYDESRGVEDVPSSFLVQESIFVSGSLWFLNDATRFDPAKCTFTIGAVPYPAASGQGGTPITTTDDEHEGLIYGYDDEPLMDDNGDYIIGLDLENSSLKVPYTSTECYSIVNFAAGKNGITPEIAFAIIYDLNSGLGDDPEEFQVSTEQAYRNILMKKFNNKSLYVDVLMSVDDRTYFELIEILSMTVGDGSHYKNEGLWTSKGISTIIKQANVTPADQLAAIEDAYITAMRGMGYMV